MSGTPVFGKDGDFKGYSGTATNIGERVEAEDVNGGGNMYRRGGAKMYHGLGGSLSA